MIEFVFANMISPNRDYSTIDPAIAVEFSEWRKEKNLSYFDMFEAIGPKYEDIVLVAVCNGNITTTPIDTYEYGRCYYLESNCTSNMVGK